METVSSAMELRLLGRKNVPNSGNIFALANGPFADDRLFLRGYGSLVKLFEEGFGKEKSEHWDSDLNEYTNLQWGSSSTIDRMVYLTLQMRMELCLNRGYDFRFEWEVTEILRENPNWEKSRVEREFTIF